MEKKKIFIQFQGLETPSILFREIGFLSVNTDNIRITIDGYDGFPCQGMPRKDSKVEIMDEKEVFRLIPEELLAAIRFYWSHGDGKSTIDRANNRFNVIMPDWYKNTLNALNSLKTAKNTEVKK